MEKYLYGTLGIATLVLLFGIIGTFSQPSAATDGTTGVQLKGPPPAECGNINDAKNLQHLSHHPDQFQECYNYVDPVKFKQAVGQDLSNFKR